jgi:hypothetical protein
MLLAEESANSGLPLPTWIKECSMGIKIFCQFIPHQTFGLEGGFLAIKLNRFLLAKKFKRQYSKVL